MTKSKATRAVGLFALVIVLYSWPVFFCADAWLEPMFSEKGNVAAARLSVLLGHTLGMLGPALAALLMWRVYHKESPPPWKWSLPKYYAWVALAMLALWTVPGLTGLLFGDAVVSPIEPYMWISIAVMLALGWVSGMGEETGWCAYLLPLLSPTAGKTRAMIISGVIRGLWHWPVVVIPVIMQVVAGERTPLELLGAAVVIALQLAVSNVLFGAAFGWIWYHTESIPLVGWTHFWHNLTRDLTIMLLVGYGDGLWAAVLAGLVTSALGLVLLDRLRRDEGLQWPQVLVPGRKEAPEKAAQRDDTSSGTRVLLTRRSMLADSLKAYKVLVDGKEVAEIKDGQSISIPVSPGSHAIQLRLDQCGCQPAAFSVSERESVQFECGSTVAGWRILFALIYVTLLRNRYLWIRQVG
jgi:membrane protease YdiL (CAAX protease family)